MASPLTAENVTFEGDTIGSPPRGWLLTMTGRGAPKWTVERDLGATVLKQSGEATFPLALKLGTNIRDGFADVTFKPISGSEDRAGGIVWRAKDANNYYVVRANALEDNVVLYKTVNGVRSSLDLVGQKGGYGVKTPVPDNDAACRVFWPSLHRRLQRQAIVLCRGCDVRGCRHGWPLDEGR